MEHFAYRYTRRQKSKLKAMGDKTKEVKTQLRLTMSQNLLGTKYERKKNKYERKKTKIGHSTATKIYQSLEQEQYFQLLKFLWPMMNSKHRWYGVGGFSKRKTEIYYINMEECKEEKTK